MKNLYVCFIHLAKYKKIEVGVVVKFRYMQETPKDLICQVLFTRKCK